MHAGFEGEHANRERTHDDQLGEGPGNKGPAIEIAAGAKDLGGSG